MTVPDRRLSRSFYEQPVLEVARLLVGKVLVSRLGDVLSSGRIVETEAYAGLADPASHAVRLRRSRERMGGEAGLAYVHLSHGLHNTLNVVAEPAGSPSAVLIRAIEPIDGLEVMRERRAVAPTVNFLRLAAGPGNLARALGISLEDDGRDLTADPVLFVGEGPDCETVWASPRIGLSKATEVPWRFFDPASRSVSAHRRGQEVT